MRIYTVHTDITGWSDQVGYQELLNEYRILYGTHVGFSYYLLYSLRDDFTQLAVI